MLVQVDGLRTYYYQAGDGPPILFLHGWGGRVESFKPVLDYFERRYRVCAVDLPGFGRTERPPADWGSADYARFVMSFCGQVGIRRAHVLGHSFGGRVSLALAARFPGFVEKLVLVNSAGIRARRRLRSSARAWIFALAKRALPLLGDWGRRWLEALRMAFGSQDYREAGPLRGTLVKLVNEDARDLLPQIEAPTLIVWGDRDTAIPLGHMQILQQGIRGARLVVLEGAGHFSYLDRLPRFCQTVAGFLEGGIPR